jgi:hypothetical protein
VLERKEGSKEGRKQRKNSGNQEGKYVRAGGAVMIWEGYRLRSDVNAPFDELLGRKDALGVQEAGQDGVRLNLRNCRESPMK